MHASMSDKALLECARNGDDLAAALLFKRWAVMPEDVGAVLLAWRKPARLSVRAAKHIAMRG